MAYIPLPAAQVPRNALLDFQPLNQAVNSYKNALTAQSQFDYQAQQDKRQNARADEALSMQRDRFNTEKQQKLIQNIAGVAQMVDQEQDPAKRQAMWGRFVASSPAISENLQKYGVNPSDHLQGPKFLIAEARGYQDPLKAQETQADIGLKRAQAKYYDERPRTAAGGSRAVIAERLMAENPDLSYEEAYTIAMRGSGVTTVGDELVDRNTGKGVRNVGPQLAGGERAKATGKAEAELASSLPKLEMGFRTFSDKSDRLVNVIDRALTRIGPNTTGWGALLASLPATEARALDTDLSTIKANIGFEELQAMRDASPTGGALGQVSEMENRLLQAIRGSLDQFNRGENLSDNLRIIRDSVVQLKALKSQQLATDKARVQGQGASSPAPSGEEWQDLGNGVRMRVKP